MIYFLKRCCNFRKCVHHWQSRPHSHKTGSSYVLLSCPQKQRRQKQSRINSFYEAICFPISSLAHLTWYSSISADAMPPPLNWKMPQTATFQHSHIPSIMSSTCEHIIDCKTGESVLFTCIFQLDLQQWWSENSRMKMNGRKLSMIWPGAPLPE